MSIISVAMTTYNGSKYIISQLDSIRLQTKMPDEVIICDDCSSDDTYERVSDYIEKYALSGWRVIKNVENLGYIDNFYQCILKTTGDYIFLSDQDDVWMKDKIETMETILANNTNVHVLSSADIPINEHGETIKAKSKFTSSIEKYDFKKTFKSTPCMWKGCTTVFTREVRDFIQKYGFLGNCHDGAVTMFGIFTESYYFLDKPLVQYRVHSNNTAGYPYLFGKTKIVNDKEERIKGLLSLDPFHQFIEFAVHESFSGIESVREIKKYITAKKLRAEALSTGNPFLLIKNLGFLIDNIAAREIISDVTYILNIRTLASRILRRT